MKEVGRLLAPDTPMGFHNVFAYKHSSGRVLLFATTMSPAVNIYDMEKFLVGERVTSLVGKVVNPNPSEIIPMGFHEMYVAYDPTTRQDKFYGPGLNNFLVFDVTSPEEPELVTSITGVAGMDLAHAFQATPDGRYGVTQMEYRHSPIRIFDLKPGLEGETRTISRPIGAWQAEPNGWNNASHNHQIRWPYVFVGSFDDGLQVINMMDPTSPYTVGYYDTQDGPDLQGLGLIVSGDGVESSNARGNTIFNGAWGINVRNADGLIVISGFRTGFWAFKMDGFDGWNGHQWGMPNISAAQDWDNGPDRAAGPARVS